MKLADLSGLGGPVGPARPCLDAAKGNLLAEKALQASSMKGNPVRLSRKQILDILFNSGYLA